MFYSKRIKKLESTLEKALKSIKLLQNEVNDLRDKNKLLHSKIESKTTSTQEETIIRGGVESKAIASLTRRPTKIHRAQISQSNYISHDPVSQSLLYNHIFDNCDRAIEPIKTNDDISKAYKSSHASDDYLANNNSYSSDSNNSYSSSSSYSSYDSGSSSSDSGGSSDF